MIKSFRNEAARVAWERRFIKGWSREVLQIGKRKLTQIHNARSLNDLRAPPGNRLEALSGARTGPHSIMITYQCRACFVCRDVDAVDVEIVAYHS
jgi:proteic killer suppression protein